MSVDAQIIETAARLQRTTALTIAEVTKRVVAAHADLARLEAEGVLLDDIRAAQWHHALGRLSGLETALILMGGTLPETSD